MSEVQFTKQFLTTLDNKSTKYQADHVFDPKTFPTRVPYTLPKLPHPPHPLPPRASPAAPPPPGSEAAKRSVSVTLKSSRNPAITLTIPSIDPASTTIQSLKEQIQSHLGGPSVVGIDKIKILSNKKPIPTSKKTISDALDNHNNNDDEVEFGIMVMGGAPDPPAQPQTSSPSTSGTSQAAEAKTIATSAPESEKANLEAASATAIAGTPMTGIEKTSPVQPGEASGESVLETSQFWDDLQGFLEQRIRDQTEAKRLRGVFESGWRSHRSKP